MTGGRDSATTDPGVREVGATLSLESDGPGRLLLSVAVAEPYPLEEERLEIMQDGRALDAEVATDRFGSRLHAVEVGAGPIEVEYSARVTRSAPGAAVDPIDAWEFLRPSRYCESDTLRPLAVAEFAGLRGEDLLTSVSSWVGTRLAYVPGSSLPTDGAVRTLLNRRGVCRDYAHLTTALLRALEVPARIASVYAPGLDPMDFHAVTEALVDGAWRVVDSTTLAPRGSLVRIATGRDAADTAFLSTRGAGVRLEDMTVRATAEVLPSDDLDRPVSLG